MASEEGLATKSWICLQTLFIKLLSLIVILYTVFDLMPGYLRTGILSVEDRS